MRQRLHHESVLGLHRFEQRHYRVERVRQGQQSKRVSGGCGVHDETLEPWPALSPRKMRREELGEHQQSEDFVSPWKCRIDEPSDVLDIEVRAAIEDAHQDISPSLEEPDPSRRGIELHRRQAGYCLDPLDAAMTEAEPERGS